MIFEMLLAYRSVCGWLQIHTLLLSTQQILCVCCHTVLPSVGKFVFYKTKQICRGCTNAPYLTCVSLIITGRGVPSCNPLKQTIEGPRAGLRPLETGPSFLDMARFSSLNAEPPYSQLREGISALHLQCATIMLVFKAQTAGLVSGFPVAESPVCFGRYYLMRADLTDAFAPSGSERWRIVS